MTGYVPKIEDFIILDSVDFDFLDSGIETEIY